jgi:hypothetical protein
VPTWGEVLQEIGQTLTPEGQPDLDGVRRKYLRQLNELTGRPVVIYASDWMSPGNAGSITSILLQDMQGLMEVFRSLPGPSLDLILHSPGGDPTAAASLVTYMRQKYDDVRVFVPLAAMSAATMWALAADRIVMGRHSQLGPIDPQLQMPQGMVPAAAIRRQFETAQDECAADPSRLSGWLPTLQQYFPGLLEICADAEELGKKLVGEWLAQYMFRGREDAETLARAAAEYFADDRIHIAHSRGIMRAELVGLGLVIDDLEDDPALQDAVLSVHHATMHTLTMSGTAKIIENHLGRAFVNMAQQIPFSFGPVQMLPAPPPGP